MNKPKRFTAILLAFIMLFTGCVGGTGGDNSNSTVENHTETQKKEIIFLEKPQLTTDREIAAEIQSRLNLLVIGMYNGWVDDVSSPMYKQVNTAIFRSILEHLYERDTGEKFDYANTDGNAYIYTAMAERHFPLTAEETLGIFKRRGVYNRETDTVMPSDGLGNVAVAQLTGWTRQGDIITANYDYGVAGAEGKDEDPTRKGVLTVQINRDNSLKFLSARTEPKPHTVYEDLSFLPRDAKAFFDENRPKALAFSQSGGAFLYGQYKAFDLMKTTQPVQVEGKNYLVTTRTMDEVIAFLETIYHSYPASSVKWNGKCIEVDGHAAFIDRDMPYVGETNMTGYRVFKNTDEVITFTQQIYTNPNNGLFTGIAYELYNTENGWRIYQAEYVLE